MSNVQYTKIYIYSYSPTNKIANVIHRTHTTKLEDVVKTGREIVTMVTYQDMKLKVVNTRGCEGNTSAVLPVPSFVRKLHFRIKFCFRFTIRFTQ